MPKTLKHSLLIFVAGLMYGFMIPLARTAYATGFTAAQITVFQYLVAIAVMGVIVAAASRRKMRLKTIAQLLGVGVLASGVSIFYYRALELLPSATAVTLLFQFVWMGVLVQAVRERRLPRAATVASVLVVMLGTALATGLINEGMLASLPGAPDALGEQAAGSAVEPAAGSAAKPAGGFALGVVFGLLSAAFYTAFLTASGRVATELPAVNRSLVNSCGSFLVAFLLCPTFFASGAIPNIGWVGVALGLTVLVPVFLIAHSAPHLPSGLATIMAASELPSGIVCAAVFMGDAVTPLVACGVAVVLAGIVLSELDTVLALLKERRKAEP